MITINRITFSIMITKLNRLATKLTSRTKQAVSRTGRKMIEERERAVVDEEAKVTEVIQVNVGGSTPPLTQATDELPNL